MSDPVDGTPGRASTGRPAVVGGSRFPAGTVLMLPGSGIKCTGVGGSDPGVRGF